MDMRITTQMLNESARKASLPINNTSLLNYIKNDGIGKKERLSGVGVTFAKDGTAEVNIEKLKTSDLEILVGLFGKDSNFVSKIQFLSARISDNAF